MRCRCGVRAKEDVEDAVPRGGAEIQRRVLELIATGQSLELVLHELVLGMEQQHPSMRGSVLLVVGDGTHLLPPRRRTWRPNIKRSSNN
jgi:hypothetical protein